MFKKDRKSAGPDMK